MIRSQLKRRLVVAAGAAALATACDEPTRVCPSDLRTRVTPAELTLAVGESAAVFAEALGCGGTELLAERFVWTSSDTLVARVDAATGRVTGYAPGATDVIAAGQDYHGHGRVAVTVR